MNHFRLKRNVLYVLNHFKMVNKHVNCNVIHLMNFMIIVYNNGKDIIQVVLFVENKSKNN